MPIETNPLDLLELAAALVASGLVSGVLAGLFGVGGGAVLVPVFFQVLGLAGVDESVRMHVSIATSTGIILPTALRSFGAHHARGVVDMELLRSWVIWIPLGVVVATAVASSLSSEGLRIVFAVIAVLFAIRMLFNRASWRLGPDLPKSRVARAIVGAVIGFFSTLMGIGGGVLNNTYMTLYGRPMHQAVATSSGVGVLIAIPGTLGFIVAGWGLPDLPPFSLGYVNLMGVLLVVPITLLTAPLGVRLAHALPKRRLEILFGLFLLSVAAKFIASLL
ncbi:sulfite exporter TauE/SafE family protein [Chthonobacter rhizosphaerae]|uniref:sulfite exporter TauE/SafE family protein n=1 Tax=Chthonobacter rhizosphaerae TaxID=2735553 RepID=UPI0015EFAEFE|nr:sulfite exporter TauE/SafE family protein [Chthonobacter rhizosphaerae]